MLSDQEYLGNSSCAENVNINWPGSFSSDLTEVGFFLGELRSQLINAKPSDKTAATVKYFENVRSGSHVIGMPYSYITESNHNKRSFVLLLLDAFKGFPENMEITPFDMFNMIESFCPNFSRSLVLEVSQSLQRNLEDDGSSTKHMFKTLAQAVYCSILYDDWLRLISDYFAEETSTRSMNLLKLKAKIEDFYVSISPSIYQPPLEVSYAVLEASNPSSTGTGTSSYLVEVTLDQFRRTFLLSEAMREELRRLSALTKQKWNAPIYFY